MSNFIKTKEPENMPVNLDLVTSFQKTKDNSICFFHPAEMNKDVDYTKWKFQNEDSMLRVWNRLMSYCTEF